MRGERCNERVLERTLPICSASARLARATAQAACRAWRIAAACDVAVLAVSELVGNAARHAVGGPLTLRLSMTPRRLRLEVTDACAGTPSSAPRRRTPRTAAGCG